MKKLLICAAALLLLTPLFADLRYSYDFLAAVNAVADNTTEVHGTDYTSRQVDVSSWGAYCGITIEFTPAAGAAVDVTYEFAVSMDNGGTYTTADNYSIAIPSNTRAVGGVVRYSTVFDLSGVSHIRLDRMIVGNGAGNCTAMQAHVSY